MRSRVVRRGGFAVGLERFLCFSRNLVWYGDLDGDELVAFAAVTPGDTLTSYPQYAAVRRSSRQFQGHRRAVEGRHLDLGAERGFREGDRHSDREVVARAAEQRVRPHVHEHDEVASGAASLARRSLALQSEFADRR